MMPWPILHAVPGQAPPPPRPAVRPKNAKEIKTCAYCRELIRFARGNMIPDYWEVVDELPPGVALPMECPKRPKPGWGQGSFFQHTPIREESQRTL